MFFENRQEARKLGLLPTGRSFEAGCERLEPQECKDRVFSGDNLALMISIALFGLIVRTILIGEGEKEREGASFIFLCCNLDPAVIRLNEPFTE